MSALFWLPLLAVAAGALQLYAPEDPCYDAEDKARVCIPDFVNAAYGTPVVASSTCGEQQTQRYCEYQGAGAGTGGSAVGGAGAGELHCSSCEANSFPPRSLTDLNNSNNVTCWRSAPLATPTPPGGDNVTLTLSLGKKYELTYVSLQFCPRAPRPDSLMILKSSDHGHSWQPFQYYSSQCRRIYGRPSRNTVSKHNEQEPRCSAPAGGAGASRIAFSTLEGRPSARDLDSSPVLQDWVTATDIRIIFHRLQQPAASQADPLIAAIDANANGAAAADLRSGKYSVQLGNNNIDGASPLVPSTISSSGLHYAVSDFSVGGRCKCNGHASKCAPDANGQLSCECRHNTAGRDCERCKSFFFDRPWGRATARDANECKSEYTERNIHIHIYPLFNVVFGGFALEVALRLVLSTLREIVQLVFAYLTHPELYIFPH